MNEFNEELNTAYLQIEELLDRNRIAHVKDILARLLPKYPDDASLLYFAGYIAYHEDDLQEAHQRIEALLADDPDSYRGRVLMAHVYDELDRFTDAEHVYISLLKDYPEDADQYAGYAELMMKTLHIDKASRLAAEALRLDPHNPAGLRASLLASLVKGEKSAVDETLADLMGKHPEAQTTAYSLINVLLEKGDNKAAQRLAREMLAARPDDRYLLDLVKELSTSNHWSLMPMWPMQKFGWGGSVAIWFVAVIFFNFAPDNSLTNIIALAFLIYVAYSWIWPPILRKIMRR